MDLNPSLGLKNLIPLSSFPNAIKLKLQNSNMNNGEMSGGSSRTSKVDSIPIGNVITGLV